ncbi:MAG TPA: fused MFS/spermidine synthase [Tepidisphaeraceae bacterium]|nr:fused MFS/spermidine synthase [Tepidisphaeraceae bacterium]
MTDRSADASFLDAPGARVFPRALAQPLIIPLFCLTLFCSSGLLFLAEPMFAKMVLPLLGGTPAVWNTCMVSFQALLLGAYAYGHWSIRWLGIRRQAALQLFMLIAVAIALPIAIPRGWQPPAGQNPIFWLLAILPIGVGLPFFAAASTAPVLQRWFSSTGHRASGDPYFLYAASNLGSMVALLAYPTLLEPLMHLADQSRFWSAGYLGLIALVGCCALMVGPQPQVSREAVSERITAQRRVKWILLAMIPSSLLLGATTFITTDIAAVPLLWIVPLALYLLSFIFVFASRPIVSHRLMVRLQPVVVLWVALFMLGRVGQPVWMVLTLHLAALFVSSMVCHGELAADRPSVGRLTDFYLTMSLGGVLGGLFNALLAPMIFSSAAEYPIALIAACALCPRIRSLRPRIGWTPRMLDVIWPILVGALAWGMPRAMTAIVGHDSISLRMIGLGVAVMAAGTAIRRRPRFLGALAALFLVVGGGPAKGEVLAIRRSFFGIHRVVRNPDGPFNDLYHGTTVHGRQFVDIAGMPCQPTIALTYYHRTGPVGQLFLQRLAAGRAQRIGIVGLGVGSLAAYAGKGTQLTYYEIDPAVRWMAEDSGYFSFLSSAKDRGAKIRVVMGDARLTLRDAPSRSCDILVLDAFCGDAIPVHLLTREAMSIYKDKLADGGVLAIHISNMYLNLLPVCSALVADAGCVGMYQDDLNVSPRDAAEGKSPSQWVIVARSSPALTAQRNDPRWKPLPPTSASRVWTDDFSNILGVFRWR